MENTDALASLDVGVSGRERRCPENHYYCDGFMQAKSSDVLGSKLVRRKLLAKLLRYFAIVRADDVGIVDHHACVAVNIVTANAAMDFIGESSGVLLSPKLSPIAP